MHNNLLSCKFTFLKRTSIQVPEIMRRVPDAEPLGKLCLESNIEFCKLDVTLARFGLFAGSIGVFTWPV